MADTQAPPATTEIFLTPFELAVSERYNVRRYMGDEEAEAKKIERLAARIEQDGQMETVIATEADGKTIVISGHRRRRAIVLINESRTALNKPLMKVRVRIDNEGDLKRKALTNNIQRENLSAMEIALEAQALRVEHKWEGFKGAKLIAAYLGLDLATITQSEKLLTASKEIQDKIHNGEMSAQAAFDMLNVVPEKEEEVLARARENQERKDRTLTPKARKLREERGIQDGERLERPAVVEAIRSTPGATEKPIVRTRKELLEAIEQFDSPAYGFDDGAVRTFIRYFIDKFAPGAGTPDTMRKKFDVMVAKAAKGTKPEKVAEPKPEKVAVKKAAAKKSPTPIKAPAKKPPVKADSAKPAPIAKKKAAKK